MSHKKTANYYKLILIVVFGTVFYNISPPETLSTESWHLLVLFISIIFGAILQPVPFELVTLTGLAIILITKTLSVQQALGGFGSTIVWLIVIAFLLARAVIKTGLGNRIAYFFIYKLGRTTIGLTYCLIITEGVLAPFMPSAAARGSGIIFPIASSLVNKYTEAHKLNPDLNTGKLPQKSKLSGFVMHLCFQSNVITSAMFLTAMAANPLIVEFAASYGIKVTWASWATICAVPGLCNLLLLPLIMYVFCNPGILVDARAPILAKRALKEMGPLKLSECIVLIVFCALILMWSLESIIGIKAVVVALIGLVCLTLTNVLTVEDIFHETNAWRTLIWFGILVMLSEALVQSGVMEWLGVHLHLMLQASNFNTTLTVIILSLILFFTHYFFASMTAHLAALYSVFLGLFLAFDLDPVISVFFLLIVSLLSGGVTNYSSSAAPMFYEGSNMSMLKWWRTGFIISILNITIWIVSGFLWTGFLGIR